MDISKRKRGQVVSDKMDKTITVLVRSQREHALYHKKYNTSKKIKAHDKDNKAKAGDIVEIKEVRPISKDKSWQLVKVISEGIKNDSTI